MPMTMTFRLALPGSVTNARHGHHMARHRAVKTYLALAIPAVKARLVARRQLGDIPIRNALVTAEVWVAARYDDDGVTGLIKLPLDALVRAGVLVDDKRPHCTLTGIPEQHVMGPIRKRKGETDGDVLRRKMAAEYRVELTVEARNGG